MADNTPIEWTDATWNPITGCTLVSEGCRHCYAARLAATRLQHHPSRKGLARLNAAGEAKFTGEVRFNDGWLDQPLRWKRPRMIFVAAHGDLFHPKVTDEQLDQIFAVMALCPQHTFQVLTKRPERARAYLTRPAGNGLQNIHNHIAWDAVGLIANRFLDGWKTEGVDGPKRRLVIQAAAHWPLPNVWLGTSVEDQKRADERIPELLGTPAAVRWISAEPLLGPVEWKRWLPTARKAFRPGGEPFLTPDFFMTKCEHCGWSGSSELVHLARGWDDADCICPSCCRSFLCDETPKIDWVVAGGESGPGARPMHPDWVRSLRDQCAAAGVPFLFKQWGAFAPSDPVDVLLGRAGKHARGALLHRDGHIITDAEVDRLLGDAEFDLEPFQQMIDVGKGRAGRLLDGVLHDGFPARSAPGAAE